MKHSITISTRSEAHSDLHSVLVGFGFAFQVDAESRVGLEYHHPTKLLDVVLTDSDGELRAAVRDLCKDFGEQTITMDDFTLGELQWLESADNEAIYLSRELHLLLRARRSL